MVNITNFAAAGEPQLSVGFHCYCAPAGTIESRPPTVNHRSLPFTLNHSSSAKLPLNFASEMSSHIHIPYKSRISSYVTAIWEANGRAHASETILPQGYVEMVFNLADPVHGIMPNANTAVETPMFFLQGWNSHAVNVQYTGQQHLFGVRLHPYTVRSLLGILPGECRNTLIDLSLIRPQFHSLWQRLNEAKNFEQRVHIIETVLPAIGENNCERTSSFCDYILSHNIDTPASVESLADHVCYSVRQLNRKAQALFGASAEELIVYKKFRNAVHLMHGEKRSLTHIAYSAGFYDQAHFCRVFKTFGGMTAKQYQLQKSELPFHLFA